MMGENYAITATAAYVILCVKKTLNKEILGSSKCKSKKNI